MEQVRKTRVTRIQLITSKMVIIGLLVFISVLFGVLSLLMPPQYLMAIIVMIVSGLILFIYPFIGLLVYQFIMIIQPAALFPSLEPLRIERVMALFLIVALIINTKLRHDKLVLTEHRLIYLMGFFILAMVVSVPTSYWPTQSVEMVIEFLKIFAYFILIINIIKTSKRLKIFLWEYLLLIGYVAISSAIAYAAGNVAVNQGIVRAQGLTGTDPNTLAVTLVLALPFHFMLFRMEKNLFLKGLSILLAVSTIYTMVLTGSRGGFVGLATLTLLCWWVLPRKGIRLFILLAGLFTLIAIMPEQYQQRYATIVSSERDPSTQLRFTTWQKGLRMFIDHPFTGVGTGAFGTANEEEYSVGRKSNLKAHNLYIQLSAELGIVGIVAFALYVAGLLSYQNKYRKLIMDKFHNKDWLWGCLMAMTISTTILLVIGMFGHNLYRSNWYFYGALTIAIGTLIEKRLPEEEASSDNVNK